MDSNSLEFKPQRPARERSVRRRGLARNRSESNATKTLARTWRARTQPHAKASPPLLFHTHTMSRAARRDTRQGGAPVGQERVVQQRRCPGHVAHEARVPDTHVRTRDLPPSTHLASAAAAAATLAPFGSAASRRCWTKRGGANWPPHAGSVSLAGGAALVPQSHIGPERTRRRGAAAKGVEGGGA